MWKVVLTDGTEYTNSRAAVADGLLVCFINNATMRDVIFGFSDPDKTHVIEFLYDNSKDTFDGYTGLLSVFKDRYSNEIIVTLEKEE